jgi:hypothetical protein
MKIRTLLIGSTLIAVGAVSALGVTQLFSFHKLDGQQDRLVNVALPLMSQNMGVYDAVTDMTRQVLSARSSTDLAADDSANARVAAFEERLASLQRVSDTVSGATEALADLARAFRAFLQHDQEMQASRARVLTLEEQLAAANERIATAAAYTEYSVNAIKGKMRLADRRARRKLRRRLEMMGDTPYIDVEMQARLIETLVGKKGEINRLAVAIRYDTAMLAGLARQLMLEDTHDGLISVKENRMSQRVDRLRTNLAKLTDMVKDHPEFSSWLRRWKVSSRPTSYK